MLEVASTKTGWTTVAFGDVVRQVKDKVDPEESGLERYVAGEHMDTDDLRIRRWGEIGEGYLGPAFHMRFKPGHVLYGSRRTYLRKVAVADFEGITANTTYVLESADPDVLLPELLPFIMQTDAFNQHSVRESKGSVNPYVNFSDLAWFEFALPPLQEQRRIVEAVRAVDTAVVSIQTLAASIHAVEHSIFDSSLADRCGTVTESFESFCDFITDGDHNPPKRVATGVPYLVVASIANGAIDKNACTFISESDYERVKRRYEPAGGDVLLSCVGSVGDAALVPDGYVFAADRSLAIYRPQPSKLHPIYAMLLLRSPKSQRYFASVATGTAQLHLYLTDLRRQTITVPSIKRQVAVANRTGFLELRIGECHGRKAKLDGFRKILLCHLARYN